MTPDGPLRKLTSEAAEALAREVAAVEPEAVAVVLLHAYRHPQHELRIRDALAHALPDAHVSLSHEVVGTFREYERAATTEIDAALSPLLGRYLRRLAARTQAAGLPEPAIMQSNGGLIDLAGAADHAAWTVLSGPAGGAAGAAYAARAAGVERALCLDMGGTSADVCVVHDGAVAETGASEIAGRPIALPTLDIHTVGAGGGSIAWGDPGGALRVGPRSAGAVPGPACYGRGGEEPTVTDANLLLGHLPDDVPLAGGVALDRAAAERAVGRLARELGLDPNACAEGIVRVANAEMTRALRVVTVERGIDPRDYALVAFGGAGPLHAVAVAEELGIERVIAPRASGVLAALGLVVAPRRRDVQRSVLRSGTELTAAAIAADVAELATAARDALGEADAAIATTYELRYRGQAFELAISPPTGEPAASPAELRERFEVTHEERYGYRDAEQEVELVTVRVSATTSVPVPPEAASTGDGPRVGTTIPGPAVLPLPESTLVIPAGWVGTVLADGAIDVRHATREGAS
jgi:N-methylhydantoinase A